MTKKEFFDKWLEAFASEVPKQVMKEHVLSRGNLPWHIFTWGNVKAIEGPESLKTLQTIIKGNYYYLVDNYQTDKVTEIKNVYDIDKLIIGYQDVYFTAKDFSWTFVHTHERYIGPFLLIR